mmetsp:Transcript_17355/g.25728  ORF Transcript_17355/g.25728 Transcript_17355/m.25728 type:complete len:231 (-) Transcript_17355:103-795(-)|eukprot:CAMPEP_0171454570 /NCGR_PEP_ID=MMETSP0945-20130129/1796_1 /TAXON_ID=109269 /ORGANISM="Vaucheria litorea, Strain CCMP2940" /LENGTH=230 /DNA_ID=CAMNT_0011979605 /DNA_START=156 /DNA_END=848 /DNA_ORIENTATION=-
MKLAILSVALAYLVGTVESRAAKLPLVDYYYDDCCEAYNACNFYFYGYWDYAPTYQICADSPDNGPGFTDQILARDGADIGVMNSQGPCEYLNEYGEFIELTQLDYYLSSTQFKPFSDSGVPRIGHETFQGDSRMAVQGQCIRVPFSSWQVLDNGNVVDNVNSSSENDCVVFEVGNCDCDESVTKVMYKPSLTDAFGYTKDKSKSSSKSIVKKAPSHAFTNQAPLRRVAH